MGTIIELLKKALKKEGVKLKDEEIEKFIEIPPSADMGDYAFPCFFLSDRMKMEPHEIALIIRGHIGTPSEEFDDIQTSGPYINFFLNRKEMVRKVVWEAITQKKKYGQSKIGNRRNIVIEFSSPNIAKPFGIGHLRSTIIGNSLANICKFVGYKPVRINYLGDWGTQFGKLIFGFKKFGSEEELEKDPIKHLLDIYVQVSKNKSYDKHSREWFKKLEDKDKDAVILWRAFKELSMEHFQKIYKILGIGFDVYSGESLYSKKLPRVINRLQKFELLKKSKKAQIVDLKKYDLGVMLIQKADGATLYSTRDIAAAVSRFKKFNFEKMIYEVGKEQELYFKQLFKVLELIDYEWAKNCIHVSHGLYLGKDGKKFATRKGKTIFMEDIIDETKALAKKEIKRRTPELDEEELEERALKITIAAIFYGDLKSNRSKDIVFDLNKFVSFEGDTGPYILYSYARASSILRKAEDQGEFIIHDLEDQEIKLVKKLGNFKEVVLNAYKTLNPSLIANYSYQLAKSFNEFYHTCPVMGSKQESFRLALVEAFRQVSRNSLDLLGIKTLEEM